MVVLITGGAGYIGSHAAVELLNNNFEIIIVDNLSNSKSESIKRIQNLTKKEFPYYKIDLLDKKSLDQIFEKYKIDSVIHFAGLKSVSDSVENPYDYYNNNITATLNLLGIMAKHKVKKIVFSSSATVYGNSNEIPIPESFELSVNNPYGRSKLMIEEILYDLSLSDTSWRIAILRYFNPIGAHQSGEIGENPSGKPNNIMPFITQVAIGKIKQLQVYGNDYCTKDGTGVRDYIHVVDLVKGHLKALEYLEVNEGVEIFNLGTGIGYSVLDLIKMFSKITKKEIPYTITNRRPGDIGVCYANPEKAKVVLGWQAEKGLLDMCRDSWNWQSKNPNGY